MAEGSLLLPRNSLELGRTVRRIFGAIVAAVLGYNLLLVVRPTVNINMREMHDRWYGEPRAGDRVRFILMAVVGSSSTSTPAFETGFWPAGVEIFVQNRGRITGKGGDGGNGGTPFANAQDGEQGGLGLLATYPVMINNVTGVIAGGGGGGGGGGGARNAACCVGGGGGGGGAGSMGEGGSGALAACSGLLNGSGSDGADSSTTAAGAGGVGAHQEAFGSLEATSGAGGAGGALATAGSAGAAGSAGGSGAATTSPGSGGAPGAAISGLSNITWVDENDDPTADDGTILGATS